MSKELQEYWDPTSSSEDKREIFNNQRDWSEYDTDDEWDEEDDDWDEEEKEEPDEHSHIPNSNHRTHTYCIYCGIYLVKMCINGKDVFVNPGELEKLKKWNEMVSGGEG